MRLSLVLSTYNGSKYINEQLDSLRLQERSFDEVLICDDCSTDDTPQFIREYIDRFQLDDWNLVINERNKGWKRNFHDLLFAASGELVFLCDQDDIWLRSKVSEMASLMEDNPGIDVLACDVEPFYEEGSNTVPSVGKGANAGALAQHKLDYKAVYILRPGCSYCVRKSFLMEIKNYWNCAWPHDAILWELAQVKGSLYLYDKRLVKFRRHGDNASARKQMTCESRANDIRELIERVILMRSFGLNNSLLSDADVALLDGLEDWLKARISLLETRGFRSIISVVKSYAFYATWKGLPVDILLTVRGCRSDNAAE